MFSNLEARVLTLVGVVAASWLFAILSQTVLIAVGGGFESLLKEVEDPLSPSLVDFEVVRSEVLLEVSPRPEEVSYELYGGNGLPLLSITGRKNLRGVVSLEWDYYVNTHEKLKYRGELDRHAGNSVVFEIEKRTFLTGPARNITFGISTGVLEQWFKDKYQLASLVSERQFSDETLSDLSRASASVLSASFNLKDLQAKSRYLRLVGGNIQTLTLAISFGSLLVLLWSCFYPSAGSFVDPLTELIPFSGFLGTLLGMASGLEVFGGIDISNEVSKALDLGLIGSQLGFAIYTTIFAIICMGIVVFSVVCVRLSREQKS